MTPSTADRRFKLILFAGEGRLGNQIFQYAALCSLAGPGAVIIAVGLDDLPQLFELNGPRCVIVPGGLWMKRLVKYLLLPLILRPLARWLRLTWYAREPQIDGPHRGSGGTLALQRGLLPGAVFVDGGYYQSSEFWPRLFPPECLCLQDRWRQKAREVLAAAGASGEPRPIFLHVRRTDYLNFTSYGLRDLMLPVDYFRDGVARARERLGHRRLLIVTDDRDWVERVLGDIEDREIVSSRPLIDFAVMAECAGGILSNSTFSLAAALFVRDPEIIVGPEYWFGFRVQRWLPPRIRFGHTQIEYLPIGGAIGGVVT